ncbi:MAG: DUF4173 domain-containing protein [Anaerolineales bacterium]|nr:DUF4173 domain-containing protein [Anaerolineales bacterium]
MIENQSTHKPDEVSDKEEDISSQIKTWKATSPLALVSLALGLAAVSDILFHWHAIGISIPIFALFCVVLLLAAGKLENRLVQRQDIILAVLILFFAGLSTIRLEPMTRALSILSMLALLAIWLWTYSSKQLFRSGILDFFLSWMVPVMYWVFPWGVLGQSMKRFRKDRQSRSVLRSVLAGLLLALPIIVLFSLLFSAADLVFQAHIEELADWLQLEALKDVFSHSMWIIIAFIFFLGAMVMALHKGKTRTLVNDGKQLLPPFLGSIETMVVLISVTLLFAVFVGIQFAYLFGGEANITSAGFTYAEYARRGFFELVAVAVLTLLLMQGMRSYKKGAAERAEFVFKALCSLLVVLVLIILGSALKRMLLYEDAYGLTRLRTYTLAGLGWITVLFAAFSLLLWRNLQVRFAQVLAAVAMGFTATLGLINVDAFIARRNLERYLVGEKLDIWHMMTLTDDAVPVIVDFAVNHTEEFGDEMLADLVCRQEQRNREDFQEWQAFHFSRAVANSANAAVEDRLADYEITTDEWGYWVVTWPDGQLDCQAGWD